MRIQFELSDKQSIAFNKLRDTIDVTTNKDLLNNALSLLNWAVMQIQNEKTVGAYDPEKDTFVHLEMPIFTYIEAERRNSPNITEKKEVYVEKKNSPKMQEQQKEVCAEGV